MLKISTLPLKTPSVRFSGAYFVFFEKILFPTTKKLSDRLKFKRDGVIPFPAPSATTPLILRLRDQANIEQTSSWLVQLTRVSSSSQLHRVNGV